MSQKVTTAHTLQPKCLTAWLVSPVRKLTVTLNIPQHSNKFAAAVSNYENNWGLMLNLRVLVMVLPCNSIGQM